MNFQEYFSEQDIIDCFKKVYELDQFRDPDNKYFIFSHRPSNNTMIGNTVGATYNERTDDKIQLSIFSTYIFLVIRFLKEKYGNAVRKKQITDFINTESNLVNDINSIIQKIDKDYFIKKTIEIIKKKHPGSILRIEFPIIENGTQRKGNLIIDCRTKREKRLGINGDQIRIKDGLSDYYGGFGRNTDERLSHIDNRYNKTEKILSRLGPYKYLNFNAKNNKKYLDRILSLFRKT